MALFQKKLKAVPFLVGFLLFYTSVFAEGFQWEQEVFQEYVVIQFPQLDPQVRVIKPKLLILSSERWLEAVQVFQNFLESNVWVERHASYQALSILLHTKKVLEFLPFKNFWVEMASWQVRHNQYLKRDFNKDEILNQILKSSSLNQTQARILFIYLETLRLFHQAIISEIEAERSQIAIEHYFEAFSFDSNFNGKIGDEEDYQTSIAKLNQIDKIQNWFELQEAKQKAKGIFDSVTEQDWFEWVVWLKDERFVGGFTWTAGWKWVKNKDEWKKDYFFSSEKIAKLFFALEDYKRIVQFILDFPDWRNSIPRTEYFRLIDVLGIDKEEAQKLKFYYLSKGKLPFKEEFSRLFTLYSESHENTENFDEFFNTLKPSFRAYHYDSEIKAQAGYVSQTGFSVVEKFFILKDYLDLIKNIYEKYISYHPWKSHNALKFQGEFLDELHISKDVFTTGLDIALEAHPQFETQSFGDEVRVKVSAPIMFIVEKEARGSVESFDLETYNNLKTKRDEAKEKFAELTKQIQYNTEQPIYPEGYFEALENYQTLQKKINPYENFLKENILERARVVTYEFLLHNNVVAATSLSDFYEHPENIKPYLKVPDSLDFEFREKKLLLPKLPLFLGKDERVENSQLLFHKDFMEHLYQQILQKKEKALKRYKEKIEIYLEQLVDPFYIEITGILGRDNYPRSIHIDHLVEEFFKRFSDPSSLMVLKLGEIENELFFKCSYILSEEAEIPNYTYNEKLKTFKNLIVQENPLYDFWNKRKEWMMQALELSYELSSLDQKLKEEESKIEAQKEKLKALKDQTLDPQEIEALTEEIKNDLIELFVLNAKWVGIMSGAPYLMSHVSEQSMEEFFKNPKYFYEVLVEQGIVQEDFAKVSVRDLPKHPLMEILDQSLKISLKGVHEGLREVSRRNSYEEKLFLLINPVVEEKVLEGEDKILLEPIFQMMKEEHKNYLASAQTKEIIFRYASVPVFLLGSFFLTGSVGTLFFLSSIAYLDGSEYYYVYVRDYQELQNKYHNLMSNLPESEARFGSYEDFNGLRRELYGFNDPEGFLEHLASYGSINWLKFSLVLDGLALSRPIKLSKYLLRESLGQLSRLMRTIEHSPELQRVLQTGEGLSYLRKALLEIPHAGMPEDLIQKLEKLAEKLPQTESFSYTRKVGERGKSALSPQEFVSFLKQNPTEGLSLLQGLLNKLFHTRLNEKLKGVGDATHILEITQTQMSEFPLFLKKEGLSLSHLCKIKFFHGPHFKVKTLPLVFGPHIEFAPHLWVKKVNESKLQKLLSLMGEESIQVTIRTAKEIVLEEVLPRLFQRHSQFQETFELIEEVLERAKPYK